MPSPRRKQQRQYDRYGYMQPYNGIVRSVSNAAVGITAIGALSAMGTGFFGALGGK